MWPISCNFNFLLTIFFLILDNQVDIIDLFIPCYKWMLPYPISFNLCSSHQNFPLFFIKQGILAGFSFFFIKQDILTRFSLFYCVFSVFFFFFFFHYTRYFSAIFPSFHQASYLRYFSGNECFPSELFHLLSAHLPLKCSDTLFVLMIKHYFVT